MTMTRGNDEGQIKRKNLNIVNTTYRKEQADQAHSAKTSEKAPRQPPADGPELTLFGMVTVSTASRESADSTLSPSASGGRLKRRCRVRDAREEPERVDSLSLPVSTRPRTDTVPPAVRTVRSPPTNSRTSITSCGEEGAVGMSRVWVWARD